MKKVRIYSTFILLVSLFSCKNESRIIYNNSHITNENWIVEQQPEGTVTFENNVMEIADAKGCTVWFKHKLEGPITIEYDVTVIDENGEFDRVSDLNCFWMSNDPKSPNDFFKNSNERQGKFLNYHELTQYYVGYGGHNNTKTRFRRYDGNMDRPLLPEHDLSDKKFMIVSNTKIHITLTVNNNHVSYKRDNEIVFELNDEEPYTSGYFGIRTVNNHMKIENIKISEI